jgi:RND family efflux transporter MFP subunit
MKRLSLQRRTLALIAVIVPLVLLFVYVALRSGPLAPIAVTVDTVEMHPISPALFGIGTVQARYTYKIGPTISGRVQRLNAQVGDHVTAGQILGEMDPVDLDDRIRSSEASYQRAEATVRESQARETYARKQAQRYKELFLAHSTSEELLSAKRQDLQVAEASLTSAREDLKRVRADLDALRAQRRNLLLVAPADGLVVARNTDPGTTVVAGQSVVDIIDPKSLWIDARFDQISSRGLATGLSAKIVLRSRGGHTLAGHVLRVEPLADSVTEETLAKVVLDNEPQPLPPIGELAEITVDLPPIESAPTIPNAAVHRINGKLGVWRLQGGDAHFTPVTLGATDLDGHVQVKNGLKVGDRIAVYSEKALTSRSRIHVVDHIPGIAP